MGAGIAAFSAVSSARSGPGPWDCGNTMCIPTLPADDVITALKEQGHECQEDAGWVCGLKIGVVEYETRLSVHRGYISDVYATVSYPEDVEPGTTTASYLTWLASLPYANDPPMVADIKGWVEEQVNSGNHVKAKIGGYGYELEVKERFIRLSVRTVVPR